MMCAPLRIVRSVHPESPTSMVITPPGFEPGHAFPEQLSADAICFVWRDDKLLARASDPPALPSLGDLEALRIAGTRHFLGAYSGAPVLSIRVDTLTDELPGWQWRGLRSLFELVPDPLIALGGRAFQVAEWDRSHQFCGRCGSRTNNRTDERAKECPICGHIAYPRISPAMMVLVTRGKQLLLARSNRFPNAMYSALAGFVEAGESIEECIHREVLEEVNVRVTDLRYFASQSWGFPHSLMIAFTAEYAGGELKPCDVEIADAKWFSLDALPQLPGRLSISRYLIDSTIARLSGKQSERAKQQASD
jgi:NAD+ diphosphatase